MKYLVSRDVLQSDFVKEVERLSGQKVSLCYQCGKCSAGCPVAYSMDRLPNQIIRFVQLGMKEAVMGSSTIWKCASCETCTTRCPRDVDLARVMDALRIIAQRENWENSDRTVTIFNRIFLNSIKHYGRLYEIGLIGMYNLKSGQIFKDVLMAPLMLRKRKLKLFPSSVKRTKKVKELFDRVNKLEEEDK